MTLMGMDPTRYLETREEFDALLQEAVAIRARELSDIIEENRANSLANKVAERFGGKKG
jgi:BMFP domain-containing protein YqiC